MIKALLILAIEDLRWLPEETRIIFHNSVKLACSEADLVEGKLISHVWWKGAHMKRRIKDPLKLPFPSLWTPVGRDGKLLEDKFSLHEDRLAGQIVEQIILPAPDRWPLTQPWTTHPIFFRDRYYVDLCTQAMANAEKCIIAAHPLGRKSTEVKFNV